jgi:2-octaprenyl-6-methoxyphenol hydroxylase
VAGVDVLIIGAGPVGAALALQLQGSGRSVALLEARAGSATDARTLALSYGSRLILEDAGAWNDSLDATPIEAIHVSHRGAFGRTLLSCRDANVPALGYVLSYASLQQALDRQIEAAGISVHRGARVDDIASGADEARVSYYFNSASHSMPASLIVLADGGANSDKIPGIRIVEKDYGQTALVGIVTTDKAHAGIAYERFTPIGPAALLPREDHFSLIWTASPGSVQRLLALDDATFLAELNDHFGHRAGKFLSIARRASFPLKLRYAVPRVAERLAVIGAAAQALHPVAGQGFNLGLRDAADLARLLRRNAGENAGSATLLLRFASGRRTDARMGIEFTDSLVRIFSTDNPLLRIGRGLGLAMLDITPAARRMLVEKMTFGA